MWEYIKRRWPLLLVLLAPYLIAGHGFGLGAGAPIPIGPPPGLIPVLVIESVGPIPAFRVPETENHLLMIESSRYLTNQLAIRELKAKSHPNVDEIEEHQEEVQEWLLERLQKIVKEDFEEYNSRSYQRYSVNAILNLYDFADDLNVHTAAGLVLDYASAKFAVGSNRGRRFAPFRRKSDSDGYNYNPEPGDSPKKIEEKERDRKATRDLYNTRKGSDHQVARFFVLAGQTQLISAGHLDAFGISELVNPATSPYRLADPILELAVNRNVTYLQRIHHEGVEIYSGAPSFLISAGGVRTGIPNTPIDSIPFLKDLGLFEVTDYGTAMPTVLVPTAGGRTLDDLIRFEGVGIGHERTNNTCVSRGFACGVNLVIPDFFSDCLDRSTSGLEERTFINSARCSNLNKSSGPHFYLFAARRTCSWNDEVCDKFHGGVSNYGFLEVVDAPEAKAVDDQKYNEFRMSRVGSTDFPHKHSHGKYRAFSGDVVEFDILGPENYSGGIKSVNGQSVDVEKMPLASGEIINSNGDGQIIVRNPNTNKKIILDFRDRNDPKWSSE